MTGVKVANASAQMAMCLLVENAMKPRLQQHTRSLDKNSAQFFLGLQKLHGNFLEDTDLARCCD